MIADLPMYEFPWTASALDELWTGVARRLRAAGLEAPWALTRGRDLYETWWDRDLILGQSCGYPYWRSLRGAVALIATPAFVFEGCEGADHCSFIVARRGERRSGLAGFRGARAAINARDSNTGMNLFRAAIAPIAEGRAFFSEVVVTGAHQASLVAVASGAADIAAIDSVSIALLRAGRPELVEEVETIARTPSSPCLPFIASLAFGEAKLAAVRRALSETFEDPGTRSAMRRLGLAGASVLGSDAYARVLALEADAVALGYPELA